MAIGAISEDVVDEVSGAPSLNRNPDAPARNAGTSSSLAEAADSRTTPVIGTCRRINRTVAAPFIPGICASTSSTWGWCALANSKAEGPSPASPITTISAAWSSTPRTPVRISTSSSAIPTVIRSGPRDHERIVGISGTGRFNSSVVVIHVRTSPVAAVPRVAR